MRCWMMTVLILCSCTARNPAFRADESGSSGSATDAFTSSTTGPANETDDIDPEESSTAGVVGDVAVPVACSEEQIEAIEWCMAGVEWQTRLDEPEDSGLGVGPWRADLYLPCIAGGSNKYFSEDWFDMNGFDPDPATAYFEMFCEDDDGDTWWCADVATYDGSVLEECAFRFSEGLAFNDRFGDDEFDGLRDDLREANVPGCADRCIQSAHAATYPPATGPTLAGDVLKWALSATVHRFDMPAIARYPVAPDVGLEVLLEQLVGEIGWEFASATESSPFGVCSDEAATVVALQREERLVVAIELGPCG